MKPFSFPDQAAIFREKVRIATITDGVLGDGLLDASYVGVAGGVAGFNAGRLPTLVLAAAATFSSLQTGLVTSGYATPGDYGAARYFLTDAEPSHQGWFQSADGKYWELAYQEFTPEMFGAKGTGHLYDYDTETGGDDDYAAFHALASVANYYGNLGVVIDLKPGAVYRLNQYIVGFGSGVTDVITRSDGTTYSVTRRSNGNGVESIIWAGIKRLTIRGYGATIVTKADFHITEADIMSSTNRAPTTQPICAFRVIGGEKVFFSNFKVDGEWRYSTCPGGTFTDADVDAGADTITIAGHGFTTGSRAGFGGLFPYTRPGGVSGNAFFIIAVDADTVKLATTLAEAQAGTAIDITSTGLGTFLLRLNVGQRGQTECIAVFGASCYFDNVEGYNSWQDGFQVNQLYTDSSSGPSRREGQYDPPGCEEVVLNNCKFEHNARQGATWNAGSKRSEMWGGSLSWTGYPTEDMPPPATSLEGINPMAGVDFEPDRIVEHVIGDIKFHGVRIVNNYCGQASPVLTPWNPGQLSDTPEDFTSSDVDTANDRINISGHIYPDLQLAPNCGWKVRLTTTGTLPAPLAIDTDYFTFGRNNDNEYFSLATSAENAAAGIAIDLTDGGSGTHTIFMYDTPAIGKSIRLTDCEIEIPADDSRYVPSLRSTIFRLQTDDGHIEAGKFTNRSLNGRIDVGTTSARIQNVWSAVEMESYGRLIQVTEAASGIVQDFRMLDCIMSYLGDVPILDLGTGGFIDLVGRELQFMRNVVDLGPVAHDGTSTDRLVRVSKGLVARGNVYKTAYDPSGSERIAIDYNEIAVVDDERLVYEGSTNPFTIQNLPTSQPGIATYILFSASLTPASVAAATVAEQTFTVTGVLAGDQITVTPPSISNSVGVAGCRVTAADTVGIRFVNPTAGALTPTSGTYLFGVIRKGW